MTLMRRDYKKARQRSRAARAAWCRTGARRRIAGPLSTGAAWSAVASAARSPVHERLGRRAGHRPAEVHAGQLLDLPLLPALVRPVGRRVGLEGPFQVVGLEGQQE